MLVMRRASMDDHLTTAVSYVAQCLYSDSKKWYVVGSCRTLAKARELIENDNEDMEGTGVKITEYRIVKVRTTKEVISKLKIVTAVCLVSIYLIYRYVSLNW